ncbi:MAG: OmpA family protein [Atopobiaceae bacterium]|nr:OmpA family protein [Atopobiaceae bacterium]
MKRIFVFISVLALACGVQAQESQHSNYIGLNVGGGLNTLTFSPADGSWNPQLGFLGELRYIHFFGEHFGLGFGVQYDLSRSGATFNNVEVVNGLVHPANGLVYNSSTGYHDWKEVQTLSFLSVPVEFYWRSALGERWSFLFGFGAQLDFPLSGTFKADDGTFEVQGYFPATNVTYRNLPAYGFMTYNANDEGDITLDKMGVSIIADLGFNYALSNHWGLYFGLYAGYGIMNLNENPSFSPMLIAPTGSSTTFDYNGVFASNQVDEIHRLDLGLKIGINVGWDCHSTESGEDQSLVSYDNEKSSSNQKEQESQNNQSAQPVQNDNAPAYSAEDDDAAREAEIEAAREARCDARRMNNPDMAQALADIDGDIAEAERAANESGNAKAKAAVADAKAKAVDAKAAHKAGKYCKAYDLFNEAYGFLSDSYAFDARTFAAKGKNDAAQQAADDADLYAEASHKDGLDCAMAACRNAKINAEIARDANNANRGAAYDDPKVASRLADEAVAMANQTGSKPALTDGKDASGKAYRGNLPECYAAAAQSFAESGEACAAKNNSADAKAAVKEASEAAKDAAVAASNGNTMAAYRAAIKARDAAQRACGTKTQATTPNMKDVKKQGPDKLPTDRAGLQNLLDQINATVHFDFAKTEPLFDAKTDLAIEALCRAMAADKNVKVLVTGHTDNVGSAAGNMTYGLKRAEALKALMVKRGAPAASISTTSRGEEEPVVENDTDEHRYQNRRAVITLR